MLRCLFPATGVAWRRGLKKLKSLTSLLVMVCFLLSLAVPFGVPSRAEAVDQPAYSDLASKTVKFNYQAYANGEALNDYDSYVLTLTGADLSTWVCNGTSLKDSVISSVYATLSNHSSVPAKEIAYQLLAVSQWGYQDLASQLADILSKKQGQNGSFDNSVYSDMAAYDALGRAGRISVINDVYARDYILNSQSVAQDAYGSWGATWGTTYYPDFMTTAQAIRALTWLPNASSDQQIQTAISNGLAYLKNQQQADGSVYTTTPWPDDPVIDTAEAVLTLKTLDIDPASWTSSQGKSPVDYMVYNALNADGSFGTSKNVMDATWALYVYHLLGGNVASDTPLGLTLVPTTATVSVGNKQQYQAIMQYFNGTSKDVTNDVTWSVADGGVASVAHGLATGLKAGQTVVTAACNGMTGSANLNVTTGGGVTDECSADIAVVGMNGELLYGPGSVIVSKNGRWGCTAMGALHATGLSYTDDNGFVKSIAGQANSGMNGWMYKVNGTVPMVLAKDKQVNKGDRIIWWYSKDMNSPGPDWDSLLKGSTTAVAETKTPVNLPPALQPSKEASEALDKVAQLLGLKQDTAVLGPLGETAKTVAVVGGDKLPARAEIIALKKELAQNAIDLTQKVEAAKGATIADKMGEVALTIPANALKSDVAITVKEGATVSGAGSTAETGAPPAPANYRQVSPVYNFGPDGTTFTAPVTLTLKVALPPLAKPENLALAWYDRAGGKWIALPAVVDVSKGLILARVSHFSDFAVLVREERKSFDDVTPSACGWAQDAVEILAGAGVVAGVDGKHYEPERAVTRAELTGILVKAMNLPAAAGNTNFKDVPGDQWYSGCVAAAVQAGLAKGYEDGTFCPDRTVTREELAAILVRALDLGIPSGMELPFTDTGRVSNWAKDSVAAAVSGGLVKGYHDGTFQPQGAVTRAECAAIIHRALVNF